MSIKYTLAKNLKSRYIFFKIWLLWINQINKTKRSCLKNPRRPFFCPQGNGLATNARIFFHRWEWRVYAEVFATKARRHKVPRSFFWCSLFPLWGNLVGHECTNFFSPLRMENVEFTRRYLPLRREGTKYHEGFFIFPKWKLPPLGDLGGPHFLIPYFYFLIIYSRSFLFMRDRQFNNRIPYFTFYIGYSTFYIPSSFLSQKNLPEKFIPLNLLKYLAI